MLPHCIGLSWIVGDLLSFGETCKLVGVWAAVNLISSFKLLFAVCAAVMDVLRCIELNHHGNQGPGGLNGTCK